MTWHTIADSKYALLTTYKRDGTPVGTPVWVAPDGDRIVVWTHPDTGKVKRIRRNADVTLQVCDPRGRTGDAPPVAGRAEILGPDGTERVREVVGGKYRYAGRLFIRAHKMFKGADGSVGLAITRR
ncbi:PPOX class F420-dependent oxidoreductase [Nocardia sp. NPDC005366]|uniref:PPOX class F420-dependent oxidoreductase n=1 Tax=Nocardia sp. NPDC005366 TaxID=3156878 RepID=UPI0033A50224